MAGRAVRLLHLPTTTKFCTEIKLCEYNIPQSSKKLPTFIPHLTLSKKLWCLFCILGYSKHFIFFKHLFGDKNWGLEKRGVLYPHKLRVNFVFANFTKKLGFGRDPALPCWDNISSLAKDDFLRLPICQHANMPTIIIIIIIISNFSVICTKCNFLHPIQSKWTKLLNFGGWRGLS